MRHFIGSVALSLLLGFVAYESPGHRGTDVGGGIACVFIVFLLTFVGPTGTAPGSD